MGLQTRFAQKISHESSATHHEREAGHRIVPVVLRNRVPRLMSDITVLLGAVGRGEGAASEELVPLVYHELRRLASGPFRCISLHL